MATKKQRKQKTTPSGDYLEGILNYGANMGHRDMQKNVLKEFDVIARIFPDDVKRLKK